MTIDVRESLAQMQALQISDLQSRIALLESLLDEERAGGSRRCVADCNNIVSGKRLLQGFSTCDSRCHSRLAATVARRVNLVRANEQRWQLREAE